MRMIPLHTVAELISYRTFEERVANLDAILKQMQE